MLKRSQYPFPTRIRTYQDYESRKGWILICLQYKSSSSLTILDTGIYVWAADLNILSTTVSPRFYRRKVMMFLLKPLSHRQRFGLKSKHNLICTDPLPNEWPKQGKMAGSHLSSLATAV